MSAIYWDLSNLCSRVNCDVLLYWCAAYYTLLIQSTLMSTFQLPTYHTVNIIVFCIQVPVWIKYYMSNSPVMDSSQLEVEITNLSMLMKQFTSGTWNRNVSKLTYLSSTHTYRLVWYPLSKYEIFVFASIKITWNSAFTDRHVGQAPSPHGDPPTRAVIAHHHLSSHPNQIVATANRGIMQLITQNTHHSNLHTPLNSGLIYYQL